MHVGDDTGAERARAAQRERVHHMQEQYEERRAAEEREQFLAELRRERERAERQAAEVQRAEHLHEPLAALFGELLSDGFRLARTFVLLPFRVAGAVRRQAQRAAEA